MTFASSASVALALAIVATVYCAAASLAGSLRKVGELRRSAEHAALAVAALVTYAAIILFGLLLTHQFSVAFVADVTNRTMSARALLSAFWGGQPGSLLLRTWMLTLMAAAVVYVQRRRERGLLPLMLTTLGVVEAFFLLVLLVSANPFVQTAVVPADGQGLNPLLQDEAMSFHPPLLLTGYMAFTLPFAVAVAGLVTGEMGIGWLRALRRWTLLAWTIQGCGLVAGAWWAYHVLGWGGYWGWDPIENVALLPWLSATALLHSLMVQERRGMLRIWNVSLTSGAFALAIFGMFVAGSGVLTSVHAFATSTVGPLFFGFLALLLLVVLALIAYRLPRLQSSGQFDAVASRESALLVNNLLLVAVIAATLWGTVFPMLSEIVLGAKIGVGATFYTQVNAPILVLILVLMGVGPLLAWRRTALPALGRLVGPPLLAAAAVWAALVLLGLSSGLAAVAYAAGVLALGAIVVEYARGVQARRRSGEGLWFALRTLVRRDRRRYAGYLVHLAIVLVAFGIIGSTAQTSREVTLAKDQSANIGSYSLTYLGAEPIVAPGVQGVLGEVRVSRDGATLGYVQPDRRIYVNWENQPVTGVAILTTQPWLDDVYVLMTDMTPQGAVTLRVYLNPLVSLLWVGAALFLVGVGVLVWPEPRRRPAFHPAVPGKVIASGA